MVGFFLVVFVIFLCVCVPFLSCFLCAFLSCFLCLFEFLFCCFFKKIYIFVAFYISFPPSVSDLCAVPLALVKEIRDGKKTVPFKASTAANVPKEELCFSIIYSVGTKSYDLDLAAYSAKDKEAWIVSIGALIKLSGMCVGLLVIFQE